MLEKEKIVRMKRRDPNTHASTESELQRSADTAVQAALERKPDVHPPMDFAHRVAMLAASQPAPRLFRAPGYGRLTAWVVAVVVGIALFFLAPRASASFGNFAFDVELAILAQLALLGWWLSREHSRSR